MAFSSASCAEACASVSRWRSRTRSAGGSSSSIEAEASDPAGTFRNAFNKVGIDVSANTAATLSTDEDGRSPCPLGRAPCPLGRTTITGPGGGDGSDDVVGDAGSESASGLFSPPPSSSSDMDNTPAPPPPGCCRARDAIRISGIDILNDADKCLARALAAPRPVPSSSSPSPSSSNSISGGVNRASDDVFDLADVLDNNDVVVLAESSLITL